MEIFSKVEPGRIGVIIAAVTKTAMKHRSLKIGRAFLRIDLKPDVKIDTVAMIMASGYVDQTLELCGGIGEHQLLIRGSVAALGNTLRLLHPVISSVMVVELPGYMVETCRDAEQRSDLKQFLYPSIRRWLDLNRV